MIIDHPVQTKKKANFSPSCFFNEIIFRKQSSAKDVQILFFFGERNCGNPPQISFFPLLVSYHLNDVLAGFSNLKFDKGIAKLISEYAYGKICQIN